MVCRDGWGLPVGVGVSLNQGRAARQYARARGARDDDSTVPAVEPAQPFAAYRGP